MWGGEGDAGGQRCPEDGEHQVQGYTMLVESGYQFEPSWDFCTQGMGLSQHVHLCGVLPR